EADARVHVAALREHVAVARVALVPVGDVHRVGIGGDELRELGLLHRVDRQGVHREAATEARLARHDAVHAVGSDHEPRGEDAPVHGARGHPVGRDAEVGGAHGLDHTRTPRARPREHGAGGTAADDDDAGPGPHDAGSRRPPRQASAAAVPCERTSPSTHTTESAPLRKPPARTAGPWSTTATTVQTALAQNVMTHPTRRPWPTPTIPHTWSAR